mmetsp:Transcript_72738/g.109705  ORF Transcript_72738/g.109705 Transcript_72738/m.109705 type:complete len:107 (-) Transcript_72738:81-401(-)
MPHIEEIYDDDETLKKSTKSWLPSLSETVSETVEWSLTLFHWSIAGFMATGKILWWGTAFAFLVGVPLVMVADIGEKIKKELNDSELNRAQQEFEFDNSGLIPHAL